MTIMLNRSNSKRQSFSRSLLLLFVSSLALVQGIRCDDSEIEERKKLEVVADESQKLDDEQLSDIVRHFGDDLRTTMDMEMDKLISEVESDGMRPSKRNRPKVVSKRELYDLVKANKMAGEDIKARIELAGDNKGALPQAGLGSMANSFVAAASNRLSAAGSYVGNKMRLLSANVKQRIPAKIGRFFKWPTFFKFKIRFHKTYKSLREELYRQMIFLRSHIVVGMQHIRFLLRRDKHLTGQNQYSDVTRKEYYEQINNPMAETDASQLEPGSLLKLDPSTVAKLQELEREGKNIFGQSVKASKASGHVRRKRHVSEEDETEQPEAKRQRRTKRHTGDHDDDDYDDELNDDELTDSEEDFDHMEIGNDLEQMDANDEELDPKDAFKLVEEFANGVDLDGLDDIESIIDGALEANFSPIDLRQTGCIMRPEAQLRCGCCYSYAIIAGASYYNCMEEKSSKAERYHARFVSDCGRYLSTGKFPAINGCKGGLISHAFQFVQKLGVQRYSDYSLARVSAEVQEGDTCAYPRPDNIEAHGWMANIVPVPTFQKSNFTWLELDQVALHLKTVGPVFVNVLTWKGFEHYDAGIYDSYEEDEWAALHSMLIVGHDRDSKGREYYIILNSHGTVWGEGGFLRIYQEPLEHFGNLYAGLTLHDPMEVNS